MLTINDLLRWRNIQNLVGAVYVQGYFNLDAEARSEAPFPVVIRDKTVMLYDVDGQPCGEMEMVRGYTNVVWLRDTSILERMDTFGEEVMAHEGETD